MGSVCKRETGFTLVELLVVLVILAVIASGVVIAVNPARRINQAKDAKVKSDIGQIATALQSYFVMYQTYPAYNSNLLPQAIVDNGDLKNLPISPYSNNVGNGAVSASNPYYYVTWNTNLEIDCGNDINNPCTEFYVYGKIYAPAKFTNGTIGWCWSTTKGYADEYSISQVWSLCK